MNEQIKSELKQKAEEVLKDFGESYLKRVEHLSMSGAVSEEELNFNFLKAVLLLEAEDCQPRSKEYQKMLKNLRHF